MSSVEEAEKAVEMFHRYVSFSFPYVFSGIIGCAPCAMYNRMLMFFMLYFFIRICLQGVICFHDFDQVLEMNVSHDELLRVPLFSFQDSCFIYLVALRCVEDIVVLS